MKVFVTGASGFVGRTLCETLIAQGHRVRKSVRSQERNPEENTVVSGNIGSETNWRPHFQEIDAIVHLASRVHVQNDQAVDAWDRYRQTNVAGIQKLVNDAIESGVKRFVFLSSIKVNGERTPQSGPAFNEESPPQPAGPYATSKWEAECFLNYVARQGRIEICIIRSPLVYGPGVKANFLKLISLVEKGLPIPLAGVGNRRSLISVINLANAIQCCLEHPNAIGQTFLVSDGEDLSTSEIIALISKYMGKSSKQFRLHPALAEFLLSSIGKHSVYERLWGSLTVDSAKIRNLLGWKPVVSVEEGIKRTVDWYLHELR